MEQGAIKGGRGSPFISGPIESVFFPFFLFKLRFPTHR